MRRKKYIFICFVLILSLMLCACQQSAGNNSTAEAKSQFEKADDNVIADAILSEAEKANRLSDYKKDRMIEALYTGYQLAVKEVSVVENDKQISEICIIAADNENRDAVLTDSIEAFVRDYFECNAETRVNFVWES